jgi:hypothetical protein
VLPFTKVQKVQTCCIGRVRPQVTLFHIINLLIEFQLNLDVECLPYKLFRDYNFSLYRSIMRITVAARSNVWTVFALSSTGIVGSNPTRGLDVYVRLFCVRVVLCVGSGFVRGWSDFKEFYRLCIGSRNWKCGQGPTKSCTAIIIKLKLNSMAWIRKRTITTEWATAACRRS